MASSRAGIWPWDACALPLNRANREADEKTGCTGQVYIDELTAHCTGRPAETHSSGQVIWVQVQLLPITSLTSLRYCEVGL